MLGGEGTRKTGTKREDGTIASASPDTTWACAPGSAGSSNFGCSRQCRAQDFHSWRVKTTHISLEQLTDYPLSPKFSSQPCLWSTVLVALHSIGFFVTLIFFPKPEKMGFLKRGGVVWREQMGQVSKTRGTRGRKTLQRLQSGPDWPSRVSPCLPQPPWR